jgi:outer membrane protein
MKRMLLLLCSTCLLALPGQAQLSEGDWIVGLTSNFFGGGNGITVFNPNTVGFAITSSKIKNGGSDIDGPNRTYFNISPNAGYFIMDNLAVGVGLGFDLYKEEDEDDAETTFGISPFARYYFDLENIKPFAQVGFGVGSYSYGSEDSMKESILHFGLGAGIALFLNDNVSVDFALGYTSESYKPKDEDDLKYVYGSFGLGIGLTMFL